MNVLHPIQKSLLDLSEKQNLSGVSLRNIGAKIGIYHPQLVKHHLSQLQKKGFLNIQNQRAVKKTNEADVNKEGLITIPILGAANCGTPTLIADEDIQGYLKISSSLIKFKKTLFALQAIGDSMNKATIKGQNIEDGDYVIVDYDYGFPKTGDYIVSIIDGMANIKKLMIDKVNKKVTLFSESTHEYPPILVHEKDISSNSYLVNGKVKLVIRNQ